MILDYTGGPSETARVLIGGRGQTQKGDGRTEAQERGSESYVLAEMKEGLANQRMQAASRGQGA